MVAALLAAGASAQPPAPAATDPPSDCSRGSDATSTSAAPEIQRLSSIRRSRQGLDREQVTARARGRRAAAEDHRCDDPPGREDAAVVGVPRAHAHAAAHRGRRRSCGASTRSCSTRSRSSTRCRPSIWWRCWASRRCYGRTHRPLSRARCARDAGFDYPPRAAYFRSELTEFLLLAHEEGFDPLSVRGSYAGAMGALQFMPSSYRKLCRQRGSTRRTAICGATGATSSPAPPTTCTSPAGSTARRCWPRRSCGAEARR